MAKAVEIVSITWGQNGYAFSAFRNRAGRFYNKATGLFTETKPVYLWAFRQEAEKFARDHNWKFQSV